MKRGGARVSVEGRVCRLLNLGLNYKYGTADAMFKEDGSIGAI